MLLRSLSLVLSVGISTAAGLTYWHFNEDPAGEAIREGEAPAEPKPSAPADPLELAFVQPQPKPPAEQPPAPAKKPAVRQNHHHKPRAATPKNRDELKTPFLQKLYDEMEAIEGVADADRDAVRKQIYEADVELRDSMGDAALRKIREANLPRQAFRAEHARRRLKTPLTDPLPLTPDARKPQPDARLVKPMPAQP
jgi:hypothetical protein